MIRPKAARLPLDSGVARVLDRRVFDHLGSDDSNQG